MRKGVHDSRSADVFFILLFLTAGLFIFVPRGANAAFGISPPFLNADNLVRGSRYIQTIFLVQDQPNQDLRIKAIFELPQSIRSWVSVQGGNEFVIPKGTRQYPVDVVVQIPKDTTLGVYHGTLTFQSLPSASGQITIALGAQVDINLTIGTNIYRKFDVPIIRPLDIEEGWDPKVYVKFRNEGNVPESFDYGTFELLDQYGGVRLAYIPKKGDFPETPPFTVREYTVEFGLPFRIGIGQYWANVAFFQSEKAVATQRTFFNVLKRGSIINPWTQFLDSFKKYWFYYVGGLLVLATIGLFWRKKRKK